MAVLVLVVFFSVFYTVSSAPCPSDYCDLRKCKELSEDCDLVIQNATRCGCCPICITYAEENSRCFPPNLIDVGISGEHCGPQLICRENKCQKKTTPCLIELEKYKNESNQGFLQIGNVKPNCDDDGNYHRKQCHPGSMCYCVDRDGQRIFGEIKNDAANEDVGCACSRKFHDLMTVTKDTSLGKWADNINPLSHFLHCSATGDYEPLQCNGDQCFCINKDLQIESKIEPKNKIRLLHCYNPEIYPETYTRSCENALIKALDYRAKQLEEKKILVGFDLPNCDLDGTYAPKQCKEDKCICVDKNGVQLETYSSERYSKEANEMTCECARENLFLKAQGLAKEMDCSSSGDYTPIQCLGGLCYCADKFGDQTGIEFDRDHLHNYVHNCTNE